MEVRLGGDLVFSLGHSAVGFGLLHWMDFPSRHL